MRFTTKDRYALRLMAELAAHDPQEFVPLKTISKRQQVSVKYLEQIVTVLTRAGYVKSVRGAQGGYRLAKNPSEYTVGMILRLTEGSLAPVPCLEDETNQCGRSSCCVTINVWKKVEDAVNNVVDSITLQDLLNDYHSLETEDQA